MPDPYRWTIAELVIRYEFEPGLRDIFVEGDRDRFLLSWFFKAIGRHRPVVYAITQSVAVPNQLLVEYNVSGNRGRVVALCIELDAALSAQANGVRGLIDKDYSELFGELPLSRFLLSTDFSCMECYMLADRVLDKFCQLYLGVAIEKPRFADIFYISVELFLLRAAKISLSNSAPWIDRCDRLCSIQGGQIFFDRNEFIDRLLNEAAARLSRDGLEARVTELRARLHADFRYQVNGHDLIRLLSWYAHQIGIDAAIYNPRPLQRGLIASVQVDDLLGARLFDAIAAWSA